MMLVPLLVTAELAFQSPDEIAIPVHNVRPSKILASMDTVIPSSLDVKADDIKGVLLVDGPEADLRQFQSMVAMFDVFRRQVSISVKVDSPLDKLTYQVNANILNNQEWKTSDGDTHISVSVTPRINADNTVTLFVECKRPGAGAMQMVFREKSGDSRTVTIGSTTRQKQNVQPDGSILIRSMDVPAPKVTFRADL